jgi:3-deoxy-manno-octulosonate cytidylyltransferase (CMP-KDO synthetase)
MLEHTWQRTQLLKYEIETIIATDSDEITNLAEKFNAKTIRTRSDHPNGMSRAKEALSTLNWDYVVVLQADELLVVPEDLEKLITTVKSQSQFKFFNLITRIKHIYEIEDRNIVKCILKQDKSILHIFRKSGFVFDDEIKLQLIKKICGTFAISRKLLLETNFQNPELISLKESIEQLAIIENGENILSVEIENEFPSVNTETEALNVENIMTTNSLQKEIIRKYA